MNNPEPKNELLECFDEQGNVIEPKTRGEVHAEPIKYWHGVVNIWLVNDRGEILCSKRADNLLGNPGKWQTYFGGHVKSGVNYKNNAVMEVWEEGGVKIDPYKLFLIEKGINLDHKHFFESYSYNFNGSTDDLKFNDGEITDVKWYSMEDYMIDREMNSGKWCNGCKPHNQEKIKSWLTSL